MFITALTTARHLTLSWARQIQHNGTFIPLPENPSQCYTPFYSSVSQAILNLRFPHQNPVCNVPLPIHSTYTAHLFLLELIIKIIFGEQYRSFSSLLCSFLHSPHNSSLLDPHMPLNTIFSNNISLRFSRNVSDTVSYPHKTTDEVIFQYIFIFIIFRSKLEIKILHWMTASIPWFQSSLNCFLKSTLNRQCCSPFKGIVNSPFMNIYLVLWLVQSPE